MADVNEIFDEISKQIIALANNTVSNYRDAAIKDANDLVAGMKADLTRWAQLLADGQLKIDEFEFLVNTQKVLVKMNSSATDHYPDAEFVQDKSAIINDGSIDLVIISSPDDEGMNIVTEALEAGKNVRIL